MHYNSELITKNQYQLTKILSTFGARGNAKGVSVCVWMGGGVQQICRFEQLIPSNSKL